MLRTPRRGSNDSGRLGACTREMNEIMALMETRGNAEKVDESVALFQKSLDEFKETHVSVQTFLSEEIKENGRINWYEPKMSTFENFLQDVEKWKISQMDPQSLIEPKDSISNVSKGAQASAVSKSSSPVASARLIVAQEKAALLARAAALKKKHALEMEKAHLNTRMEQMELEISLAESDAKLKVSEDFESKNEQLIATSEQHGQNGNGMNEYLENYQEKTDETVIPEASAVEFAGLGAIPKTQYCRTNNPNK